jgi:metallo-beta-lactamase family protein
LIEIGETKILLDCGMFQGRSLETDELNRSFGFNPYKVNHLVLSHAHIDHSGLIPRLVKNGFEGKIYCTYPTFELCKIMLLDSAFIQENDVKYINKRRQGKGLDLIEPLYTVEDAEYCLQFFEPINYKENVEIEQGITLTFEDAGHILGSAITKLRIFDDGKWKNIIYTADIGRKNQNILRDPEILTPCDVLIIESTYGNRVHDVQNKAYQKLLSLVEETCVEKGGQLLIPAFSLGRTQEIVHLLDKMNNNNELPNIKVFVDSPLSISATDIYRQFPDLFGQKIKEHLETDKDGDLFNFKNLVYIRDVNDSKALNNFKDPCIIISASGMMEAGRIKHHAARLIGDAKNTIFIAGYSEPTSLAGLLQSGRKEVRIFGDNYQVKAEIETISAFSAHADLNELLDFVTVLSPEMVGKMFLVHGNCDSLTNFKRELKILGYKKTYIPALGESFTI